MQLFSRLRAFLPAVLTGIALLGGAVMAVAAPAVITVDPGTSPGPVNPYIFGQNIEATTGQYIFSKKPTPLDVLADGNGLWDPEKKAPVPAVIDAFKAARVGMIRYPGGCLVHGYDWRKAVGPVADRDLKFGLDEYLEFCRQVGAEPMITVSDYVLPAAEMPQQSADLVEYLNAPADAAHPWAMKRAAWGHPAPYGVKWFELGNESNHGNHMLVPFRRYTPEQYATYARTTAAAMKKVDPSIKVGIVMVPGGVTDIECEWDRTVARLAGPIADFVIVHLYGPRLDEKQAEWNEPDNLMQGVMAMGEQFEAHLREYQAMVRREAGRDIPLAVTEYNAALFPGEKPAYRFSYGTAMEAADLVRIFLKPQLHLLDASYWQFFNGYFGMVHPGPDQDGALAQRPAFPLYRLWGQHFGTQLVDTDVQGPRAVYGGLTDQVVPAIGDKQVPSRTLQPVDLTGRLDLGAMNAIPGVEASIGDDGVLAVTLKDKTGDSYPTLFRFGREEAPAGGDCNYRLSFEDRFIPDNKDDGAKPNLGIGITDSRGYKQTGSGMVAGMAPVPEWQQRSGDFVARADYSGFDLVAHLEAGHDTISGRFEIRNLKLEALSKASMPAYALLTTSASLSDDKKTLYLIVFNKSDKDDIPASIHIDHFTAAGAKIWEVNGPGFAAVDGVHETASGTPLAIKDGAIQHVFPAHSMSAIEVAAPGGSAGLGNGSGNHRLAATAP